MRRLYAWLGEELTPETEAAMRDWLDANPQGRFGAHAYDFEQFGLTQDAVTPWFEDYLATFDIEREG